MEKFKNIFSSNTEEEQSEETGIIDDLWKNSTLSWSTRIKAFVLLFVIGTICSLLATFLFYLGLSLVVFALLYTLGNVCSILSTLFLMGPVSQMKKMFAPTRLIATIVMLAALTMTLISAIVLNNAGLCFLFVIIQFFAMLWYSLSYIPFARDAVKKLVGTVIDV